MVHKRMPRVPARLACSAVGAMIALLCAGAAGTVQAQEAAAPVAENAKQELADERFDAAMDNPPEPKPVRPAAEPSEGMNLLHMASPQVGGVFLYPIYAFSFVVVLFGIERTIGLRRRKVLPRKLVRGANDMLSGKATFDPRALWRLCQRYPSAGATVLQAALLRTGRPLSELEDAIHKSEEREAARLYANIRPLNLSATVAPLLGLVGTVQGMILAFYETAHLPDGANKRSAGLGRLHRAGDNVCRPVRGDSGRMPGALLRRQDSAAFRKARGAHRQPTAGARTVRRQTAHHPRPGSAPRRGRFGARPRGNVGRDRRHERVKRW